MAITLGMVKYNFLLTLQTF